MYVCRLAISKSKTTKGCCVCIFIVMTADDLVTGGPRASANIMFSEKKKKKNMCTVAFLFHFQTLNQWMFFCNCSLNLLKDKDKMQSLRLQCCDCWCTGDGYNWGICRHNVLSGTFITSETVMYVDTALLKKGNMMQNLHFVMLWLLMTYWNMGPHG